MSPRQVSAAFDVGPGADAVSRSADRWPEMPIEAAAGKLLELIPLPGEGRAIAIVAHVVVIGPRIRAVPGDERVRRDPDTGPDATRSPGTSAGLAIDPPSRRVWSDGVEVPLTFQEYELLEYLTTHPGKVFSRIQLMNALWGGATMAALRTVDVHVHRLRRKLGRHGGDLVTIRRVGYCYRPAADRSA